MAIDPAVAMELRVSLHSFFARASQAAPASPLPAAPGSRRELGAAAAIATVFVTMLGGRGPALGSDGALAMFLSLVVLFVTTSGPLLALGTILSLELLAASDRPATGTALLWTGVKLTAAAVALYAGSKEARARGPGLDAGSRSFWPSSPSRSSRP